MQGVHLFLLAAVIVLLVAALRAVVRRLRGGAPQADAVAVPEESLRAEAMAVAAAWRREPVVRFAGILLGLVVALLFSHAYTLGRGLLLAGPVAALTVVAAVTAGQVVLRPPAAPVRVASLRPRRVLDYVPHRLALSVAAMTVYLLALLTATSLMASADDLGRAGRAIAFTGVDAAQQATCRSVQSPWPGSFYAVPILLVVMAGLAVALPSLRYVTLRPRLSTDDRVRGDEALRRRAARVVLAAVGVLVAVPALAVESTVSTTLATAAQAGSCPPPGWWRPAGWLVGVIGLPTFALFAWCAVLLLAPAVAEPLHTRLPVRTDDRPHP